MLKFRLNHTREEFQIVTEFINFAGPIKCSAISETVQYMDIDYVQCI